jgi:hypothetical protein
VVSGAVEKSIEMDRLELCLELFVGVALKIAAAKSFDQTT